MVAHTARAGLAVVLCCFCWGSCSPVGARGSWWMLRAASARVSVVLCACCKGGAWQPLHATQRWGIGEALQDSGPYHGALAMWHGTPGLEAVPYCGGWGGFGGEEVPNSCDFVWWVTSIIIRDWTYFYDTWKSFLFRMAEILF